MNTVFQAVETALVSALGQWVATADHDKSAPARLHLKAVRRAMQFDRMA